VRNPRVDAYLERSVKWPEELAALRTILLSSGLTEDLKWGKPCYSLSGGQGRNVAILQEMNAFLALMFFKGALLADPEGVLEEQGPNSRSARRMCFRSVDDVTRLASAVKAYLADAIAVEADGTEVGPPSEIVLVEELRQRLDDDPGFRTAFEALTPGRQREYNLHVAGAKMASTRVARIDKHADRIMAGKGLRDR
jgi:uncharacterized protein YdeI (YjbR/CyaY-like superfamily)